jgi:xanthine dehydrogenase accessory factor
VSEERRAHIHTPAGLDIGARTPEEVALSILAQIVSLRPRPEVRPVAPPAATEETGYATDPVCGMSVRTGPDAVRSVHEGAAVWFCGPGCRDAFAADPAAYVRG